MKNNSTDESLLLKPEGKLIFQLYIFAQEDKIQIFSVVKSPNNCCLKNGSIFCIKYIGFKDKIPVVLGNKYIDLRPVSTYPRNFQDLNIYYICQMAKY